MLPFPVVASPADFGSLAALPLLATLPHTGRSESAHSAPRSGFLAHQPDWVPSEPTAAGTKGPGGDGVGDVASAGGPGGQGESGFALFPRPGNGAGTGGDGLLAEGLGGAGNGGDGFFAGGLVHTSLAVYDP